MLVGGLLCLDFVNTVDDRLDPQPVDFLGSYPGLVAWSRHAGAVDEGEAALLTKLAGGGGGEVALARALGVREALHGVLGALADRAAAPAPDLALVNGALAELLGPSVLRAGGAGLRVETAGEAGLDLDTPLRRALRSAIELLGDGRTRLVRRCAAPDCSFLFLDTTKSHTRLWCRSGGCGTRNRFRRYYARHRKQREP